MEPDTRSFSTLRLRSFHGYDDFPKVDSGLDFKLPPITRHHARVIKRREGRWMIWSPNSRQDPFYPGARTTIGLVATAAETVHRCYDGQGGRWDYTKVPQVYNPVRPWLAFIRREDLDNHPNVEYTPVYSVWVSSAEFAGGELSPQFREAMVERNKQLDREILALQPPVTRARPRLCTYRPQFPDLEKLHSLDNAIFYERALDLVTECQRGMREKQAWILFAEKWLATPPYVPLNHELPIVPANDGYIGAWINGALEEDVHWFLTLSGAPCFVINTMSEEDLDCASVRTFTEGTWVHSFLEDHHKYEYDRIGSDSLDLFMETDPHALESNPSPRTQEELSHSSLRWQLGLGPKQVLHLDNPVELSEISVGESMPLVARTDSDIAPPPVPPVASEAPNHGSWVVFAQDVNEHMNDIMLKRAAAKKGKGEVGEEEELWWDRELKRKLIFSDLTPPPEGLTADEEFGRPVPQWPFGMNANGKFKKEKSSAWMYRRERPDPAYVGRTPQPPALPIPPKTSDTNLAVERNESLEDRRAVSTPSEQAVSLGSESEEEPSRPLTPPADSDVPMRSPSSEAQGSSGQSQPTPAVQDSNGRYATSFLRLLGMGMLYSTDRLRQWVEGIRFRSNYRPVGTPDQSVRVRRVFRVMRSDVGVDYIFEVEGLSDSVALYEHATANNYVTRGAYFMSAVEFSNEARIHRDIWVSDEMQICEAMLPFLDDLRRLDGLDPPHRYRNVVGPLPRTGFIARLRIVGLIAHRGDIGVVL
ncbi:hypothetical protein C8R43DRAFT_1123001 [Mycena crocata]|nr:hypothetical protein C8R43DRAFT_1123001 [Mycena crocata]